VVERLPSKCEALSLNLSARKKKKKKEKKKEKRMDTHKILGVNKI
jgi:hypothetical protein